MGMSEHLLEMPIGFRFLPTDEELVKYYLANKVLYRSPPAEFFSEIDAGELYSKHPKCLVKGDAYGCCDEGGREWYFFMHGDDYFLGKIRTSLMVGNGTGFWRFIGEEVPIYSNGDVLGFKIYLNYFSGTLPNGKKTHWRMVKYRLPMETSAQEHQKVEEWILGRIVHGRYYNDTS